MKHLKVGTKVVIVNDNNVIMKGVIETIYDFSKVAIVRTSDDDLVKVPIERINIAKNNDTKESEENVQGKTTEPIDVDKITITRTEFREVVLGLFGKIGILSPGLIKVLSVISADLEILLFGEPYKNE